MILKIRNWFLSKLYAAYFRKLEKQYGKEEV